MMRAAVILLYVVLAALLFITFDHMMMVDQQNMCEHGDTMLCPRGLWIWERV